MNRKRAACILVAVWLAPLVGAQQPRALLSSREAVDLFGRVVNLIESTAAAVPGLSRAAAPVLENTRQSLESLRANPPQAASLTYDFLTNARAYLALADSVPKPYPFPDAAQKQFAELRAAADRIDSHFRALVAQNEARLRTPDRDNLRRYAEANEKLPQPSAERPRVVFLGDSITDGWRLNEYFENHDFVNRGISGQITSEMLGRMQEDVVDLKPKAVLVLAGTNDIARGIPLRTIENNLSMIADLAEFHNIKPLFASLLPVSDYHKDANPQYLQSKRRPPGQIRELNQWLRGMCEARNFPYVDYFTAMVDPNGFIPADESDDGLHPNAKGYRIMAPIALQAIDGVIRQAPPPPRKRKRLGVL